MKFSVITSAYQQKHLIEKTKEALKNQTFKDFEWIIADDGSTDGMDTWGPANADKYVRHEENIGYRYGQIVNKAVAVAEGEYIVWINADSYPDEYFLENLLKTLRPERLVNGVRRNVDETGRVVSQDWRLKTIVYDENADEFKIVYPRPWSKMTLNSMAMSRELFNKIGGMCEEYVGYGKEDWDLTMRAHYDGAELWWRLDAFLYTEDHKPKDEVPGNEEIFLRREKEFSGRDRTEAKMARIMDPERAHLKEQMQKQRMEEIKQREAQEQ